MTAHPRRSVRGCLLCWTLTLFGAGAASAQDAPSADFPARVLITNDNGLDDPKIVALARGFAERSEVWVVAPDRDQSGAGTFLSVTRGASLTLEPRDIGPGIRAFAVDGFPADCVLLALSALMSDSPPDLVVSGINGGDNAGSDRVNSGTVGAARIGGPLGHPLDRRLRAR